MYHYKAKVDRVVDGDTIDVVIDLGFYMTTKQRIRLYGINTPEVRGKEKEAGLASKQFVIDYLADKEITIDTTKTGKFGRWLGVIYADGENVNNLLIKMGLAEVYE